MGQEVGKVKPSSNFKELLVRVDSIRNNSSDCGEYTDEQTEELANLCTQLVDSFNHIVISLENECDRLRDGETSMVEGDYIYYRDGTVLSRPHMKTELRIITVDGEGKRAYNVFEGERFRFQTQLLDSGETYIQMELVHESAVTVEPEVQDKLPSAVMVKGRLSNGLPGLVDR